MKITNLRQIDNIRLNLNVFGLISIITTITQFQFKFFIKNGRKVNNIHSEEILRALDRIGTKGSWLRIQKGFTLFLEQFHVHGFWSVALSSVD